MKRLSMILVLALSGCSALVNGALEEEEVSSDCRRMPDGTRCGEDQVCINNLCESARCGDGVVSRGEECDELDDVSGDGCEPNSCLFTCTEDVDCEDGNPCTSNTCTETNLCVQDVAGPDTSCEPPSGDSGTCLEGLCVGEGCGNGVVDSGEECDDESAGCVACQFGCEVDEECRDESFCNGEETCDTIAHVCVEAAVLTCDDEDECTLDSCSESTDSCVNTLIDEDGDGYAADSLTCANPSDGGDCEPNDMAINPNAAELCDSVDNDCDGLVDETMEVLCFPDQDGDGFGGGEGMVRNCQCGTAEIGQGGDCNDRNGSARPTQTSFFPEPHCGGSAAECFDYNCRRGAEPQFTTMGSCTGFGGRTCTVREGWVASAPPLCGRAGLWMTGCIPDGVLNCMATSEPRIQPCR
ncbi:MAG: putative metal-binding motif-containing protein [Polyangiales bacterium]